MKEIFGDNGLISSYIDGFENRHEQQAMAEFIYESLIESEHCLVEAGTGTGKTLAYLVPTALHALAEDKRVIVTTETKSLQKQLLDKDLPMVRELVHSMTGEQLSFALCLGSANYPCRSRFNAVLQKGRLGEKETRRLQQLVTLFDERRAFSRFDVTVPEYLWREICRESDACQSYRCQYRDHCPYQMARKAWQESTVLVMNHYLLFSHIATDRTYLPDCEIVVFDEAHSLEDVASSQLGFSISLNELRSLIHEFEGPKNTGMLNTFTSEEFRNRGRLLLKEIADHSEQFFKKLSGMLGRFQITIRLTQSPGIGSDLVDCLKKFMILMSEAADSVPEDDRQNFDIARGRMFQFLESLIQFVAFNDEQTVFWLEREPESSYAEMRINGQPAEISDIFRQEIIEHYETVVMVSATLSVAGDFSYITRRLGIDRCRSLVLQSSFDYEKQVILFVARDIGDPQSDLFIRHSSETAARIISFLNGNCLLLFTSYKMLREVKDALEPMISHPIHSQDTQTASEAFDAYVNDDNAVLMGTHSFWQGIDLPGDLLRGLIMMRLPFAVPDAPPIQARIERIKQRGENPFLSYQVPEAIIKFKQGFGRLIRSKADFGVVAILDSRIASKPYGQLFLKSIPGCRVVFSLADMERVYSELFTKSEERQDAE